jgi:Cys-rich protein (TIGR01571 family)
MPSTSNVQYSKVHVEDTVDVAPVNATHIVGSAQRPWHYGLCTTCAEMNSCLECFICTPCQLSRQFNMLYNLRPELHIPLCLGVVLLDSLGVPAFFALQYVIRSDIRRRYGIEGNVIADCCISWLCLPCALQQQFLEMTSVGSCPGMSMCGTYPVAPEEPFML